MARLLASLQGLHAPHEAPVDAGLHGDVSGVTVYTSSPPVRPVWVVECYSCLTEGDPYTSARCYWKPTLPSLWPRSQLSISWRLSTCWWPSGT